MELEGCSTAEAAATAARGMSERATAGMGPDALRRFENTYRARANAWEHTLVSVGVPKRYQCVHRGIDIHPQAAAWGGEPTFLTFLGLGRSGKTWQATRLLGELRCCGWTVLWFSWSVALNAVLSEIGTDQDGRTLKILMEHPAILLDDFLAERDTPFNLDKASLILRYRYDHVLPTIFTSNSVNEDGIPALDQIYEQEPRIGSRIAEGLVIKLGERSPA
jgi:DNA replication protein DnaC